MDITPAQIIALGTATTGLITGVSTVIWKIARKAERKSIFNGNGVYERRENTVNKPEFEECKKTRQLTEDKLFENQQRIEDSVIKLGDEGRNSRERIYTRLESDRKEILNAIKDNRKENREDIKRVENSINKLNGDSNE
jgi:hypothetical protein